MLERSRVVFRSFIKYEVEMLERARFILWKKNIDSG